MSWIAFRTGAGVFILSAAAGAVSSCSRRDRVILKVGDYEITAKDAERRGQVIGVYSPNEVAGKSPEQVHGMGLVQLRAAFTSAQILKNNGKAVTEEELEREERRIDETTYPPNNLELIQIKGIFGSDKEAYRKTFILPTYVDQAIYSYFFQNDPKVHEVATRLATGLINAVNQDQADWDAALNERKHAKKRIVASKEYGIRSPGEKPGHKFFNLPPPKPPGIDPDGGPEDSAAREWHERENEQEKRKEAALLIDQVIPKTPPGRVYPSAIDRGASFQVILYVRPLGKGEHLFEIAEIPKSDYSIWRAEQAKHVPVAEVKP